MTFPACSDRRGPVPPTRHRSGRLRSRLRRRMLPALVATLFAAVHATAAWAFDPFTVKDIRVEGVQRTEAGTIFSYLPIKVGERVDDEKVAQAVKALYATGFFRDVRIEAQGDVLVVTVQERPTISSLTFVGNKEFDTDTVKKALKEVGIAEARIFDRSALERAEQELKRQYITRGKYAATVQTTVTPQERNRVAVNFTIVEGETANIAKINIVGTKAFTERQLRSEMSLSTPNWLSWYTKDDQYSKQKLQADLEALRSFYQNRGYLEFTIESTQVSISPDKEEVYITVNISEGPLYTVSAIGIAGEMVVAGARAARAAGDQAGRRVLALEDAAVGEGAVASASASTATRSPTSTRCRSSTSVNNTVAFTFFVDAGPARVRAQDQHQRQPEDARRGDPARAAAARERLVRRHADRAVEGPRAPPRLLRGRQRQHRDAAGAGHDRPGRHRADGGREEHGQPARGRRLLEHRRPRVQRVGVAAEHLRLRQRARAVGQHQPDQPHDLAHLHRAVLDRRRRVAHARALREEHRPDRLRGVAVRVVDARRRHRLRRSGVRNRHDQLRVPDRAHEADAVRQQPAGLLPVRAGLRVLDEQLHPLRGLVA